MSNGCTKASGIEENNDSSITEAKTMLWAKYLWRNSSYQQPFIWIKHGWNSVHCNVWKKYYVILLPWTLVIFFWDGHGFVLTHSILMNVPFIWGMKDIKRSRNLWHQVSKDQRRLKEKTEKERIEKEVI